MKSITSIKRTKTNKYIEVKTISEPDPESLGYRLQVVCENKAKHLRILVFVAIKVNVKGTNHFEAKINPKLSSC